MGNVVGKKKRKSAKGKGKGLGKGNNDHVVSFSANKYLQIELPREIVEDLERPRTGPAIGAKDPAKEMYEKLKALDQPAIMVPKPWSEMDQILSQIKSSAVTTPSPKSTVTRYQSQSQVSKAKEKIAEETASTTTVIDMGELMYGLDEDARRSISREKHDELKIDPLEFIKTKPFNPRKVKSLENTISFSTIHTVKELDGTTSSSSNSSSTYTSSKVFGKPETVENVLKRRTSPTRRSSDMSSPARLSNELSRRSNELTRRSSEILRRSSEIERRSNEFQRPGLHRPSEQSYQNPRSVEIVRSADLTTTRPYSEITFAHSDAVRSFAVSS